LSLQNAQDLNYYKWDKTNSYQRWRQILWKTISEKTHFISRARIVWLKGEEP